MIFSVECPKLVVRLADRSEQGGKKKFHVDIADIHLTTGLWILLRDLKWRWGNWKMRSRRKCESHLRATALVKEHILDIRRYPRNSNPLCLSGTKARARANKSVSVRPGGKVAGFISWWMGLVSEFIIMINGRGICVHCYSALPSINAPNYRSVLFHFGTINLNPLNPPFLLFSFKSFGGKKVCRVIARWQILSR